MKKVLSFVLAGAMVLSLAACGDPGSTSGQALTEMNRTRNDSCTKQ